MSRPPVEVRRALVDDLDDLLGLWSTSREELSRNVRAVAAPPDQLRPRLRDSLGVSDAPVLIARYEGFPAGYAVLRLAPVLALEGTALHIDHLYVVPQFRRRGVARALLAAATSIAERNGADQVLAGAPPSARDIHRFLARLGFSPLMVRRVVGTSQLRRRLAGEGQRRGLDDLLSRRRSLRARAARAGWAPSGWGGPDREGGDDPVPPATVSPPLDAELDPARPPGEHVVLPDCVLDDHLVVPPGQAQPDAQIDLDQDDAGSVPAGGDPAGDDRARPGKAARRGPRGRQRA